MRRPASRVASTLALSALCAIPAAMAASVTVAITDLAGANVENTVVVFDPLDHESPPTHDTAVIDQVDKRFVPNISVVRTGTAVTFPNSDHIRHQVYSFSDPKQFTLKLYAGSPKVDVVFDKPGLVVLGCNIHDTMSAFVGVVDSPYFAKTNATGTAVFNLPPGHYRLRVWNPKMINAAPPSRVVVAATDMNIPLHLEMNAGDDAVAAFPD